MGKAAQKKKQVKLRMDMFILTFAIYGIMNMLALLVFLVELKIGKRSVAPENDEEAIEEKMEEQDESENRSNMVEETQVDNPDEIIVTEIF